MEQCQAEQAGKSGAAKAAPFILVFVGEIIIAWALYGILVHMNAFTLRGGVISAALIWFGFVVTTLTANYAFHGRRPMLTVIDSVAWLGAFSSSARSSAGWDGSLASTTRHSTFTPIERISLPYFS